jgi:hypothetical protein
MLVSDAIVRCCRATGLQIGAARTRRNTLSRTQKSPFLGRCPSTEPGKQGPRRTIALQNSVHFGFRHNPSSINQSKYAGRGIAAIRLSAKMKLWEASPTPISRYLTIRCGCAIGDRGQRLLLQRLFVQSAAIARCKRAPVRQSRLGYDCRYELPNSEGTIAASDLGTCESDIRGSP